MILSHTQTHYVMTLIFLWSVFKKHNINDMLLNLCWRWRRRRYKSRCQRSVTPIESEWERVTFLHINLNYLALHWLLFFIAFVLRHQFIAISVSIWRKNFKLHWVHALWTKNSIGGKFQLINLLRTHIRKVINWKLHK